ncbi:helix-turn-helix domain-containing protein [Akkermansia sp.]|uniref:helix-turn-helix domain-containing protein n=1 Tax=Akkermansia sp. TaxID=1872421 RepID=UPI002590E30C|nr:helix-turn-helix domain-containing protein [Akkermansia sp.]MCC8091919.1 helix-turn-helix domain-containing protein [Akkermansia sp.]
MQEINESNETFSNRLRSAIRRSGMKQKELARRIKVSEITMSRYCSGAQQPKMDVIQDMASILNTSVQWLLSGVQITPPPPENSSLDTPQPAPEDWKRRALIAEERLSRIETILHELFAFAKIGK